MTKKIIIPNSKELIENCLSLCDGVILGIDGLSVNLPFYIKIEELKNYQKIKNMGKKLFIMLNKNMHNKDLEMLSKTMKLLEEYAIDGVFYYDISVVNLKEKLHISYPLIWSQEHLTTNAETCNFWQSNGASGVYLSSEITLKEIEEIRNQTSLQLFVNIFGYLPMFHSKRHLVKNYLKCFSLSERGNDYFIKKEGKSYPIIDDQNGTTVYSGYILNGLSEYFDFKKMNVDYVVLNSFGIDEFIFLDILKYISTMTEKNKEEIFYIVDELCDQNTDKGFLYKETIYKVKGGSK